MALLDDVKSELSAIDNELPIAKKAQATAMIRFGNGLHSVDHHILVQVQLDSQDAATWLQDTIKNLYGHEATLTPVSRQTPTGTVQRYVIRVPKGSAALVLQTGLYSRYTKNMVLGLPSDIVNGKIAQIKAAWRGAFLANGRLSDPGKASYLEIVCPNHEAALALVSTIERMLILMGAPRSAREWTGKRSDGEARGKANRLANFDDANMRRSAKAAAEACDKVHQAFEILGDDIPDNLKSAGQLRLDHADASLEQLGRLADPPITKDAIAGRIRRLLQLAEKTEKARRQSV